MSGKLLPQYSIRNALKTIERLQYGNFSRCWKCLVDMTKVPIWISANNQRLFCLLSICCVMNNTYFFNVAYFCLPCCSILYYMIYMQNMIINNFHFVDRHRYRYHYCARNDTIKLRLTTSQ